jgi:hypothetical protein
VVRHVEEVAGAEVLVAVRLTRVERRQGHVDRDPRLLGPVGDLDDAVEGADSTADLGKAQVANDELDGRVGGVDGVRARAGQLGAVDGAPGPGWWSLSRFAPRVTSVGRVFGWLTRPNRPV